MAQSSPTHPFEAGDLNRTACPACSSSSVRPVLVVSRDGVPPGKPDHNIVYEHTVVVLCDACAGGFVEVRKHDCFDFEEVWDQDEWYVFDRRSSELLQGTLSSCPQPMFEGCSCPVHCSLRSVRLPVADWTYGFEAAAHVRRIGIALKKDLPAFVPPETSGDALRLDLSQPVKTSGADLSFDLSQPVKFFRTTTSEQRARAFGSRMAVEGAMIRTIVVAMTLLLVACVLSAVFVFGFWSLIVIPAVLGLALLCHVAGDDSDVRSHLFAAGVTGVFVGLLLWLDGSTLAWNALFIAACGLSWAMAFLARVFAGRLKPAGNRRKNQ